MRHALTCALLTIGALAQSALAANISVKDDTGELVTLPQPAKRIISLAPHLTEQLFAIGAGSAIVGTTEFADYPPQAQQLPRVARAHHVDLERISLARPDLIVLWGSGYPATVHAALKRLGVPLFVSEPRHLQDVADSMRRLGTLTAATQAHEAATDYEHQLQALRKQYAGRRPLKVFYQVWPRPLMTVSGEHIISEAMALCGGVNVFGQLRSLVPRVSEEAVLIAQPEVIMGAEPGGIDRGALKAWLRWPTLPAVQRQALITVNADHLNRHGPRLLDGVKAMCEAFDAVR